MSEAKELSIIEELKIKLAGYMVQKEQAQVNLNQLVGAIFAFEYMIKMHETADSKKLEEEEKDGEADNEEAQQHSEE